MKGHRVRLEDIVLSQEAQAGSTAPRALGGGALGKASLKGDGGWVRWWVGQWLVNLYS